MGENRRSLQRDKGAATVDCGDVFPALKARDFLAGNRVKQWLFGVGENCLRLLRREDRPRRWRNSASKAEPERQSRPGEPE